MKKGFTLMETLMVVLIIAILVAIALPQYQLVIDQTRLSTLLPNCRSLKEAQERMWMTASRYATETGNLDINIPGNYDDDQIVSGDTIYTLVNSAIDHSITATHNKVPDVILEQYLTMSRNFSNNLLCKAVTDNPRAYRLCENMSIDVLGVSGDYTVFLLEGQRDNGNLEP